MPFFHPTEFACKHCGDYIMDEAFVSKLTTLRAKYNKPMTVTSGYRCPTHNAAVSSTGTTGPHTTRHAVDIAVQGAEALDLLQLALEQRNPDGSRTFTGIGLNQKGAGRFLHLDDLPLAPGQPRPTTWTY